MNTILNREHFNISRSDEYFNAKELQAQTGQPSYKFGEVVLKELIDNALDACENAGINPVIQIGMATTEDRMRICVSDNGTGISEAVIKSILNFSTRTSDKAAYKAPTRGAQGNAFKTIIGIPHALGGGLVTIDSLGLRHTIKAGNLHTKYDMAIIAGEGYASEAVRILLYKAQTGQDYTIFVLHDADPSGYDIARTIQDSTKRMPNHNIEVIDLGLRVQDAIDLNISCETFTRKNKLSQGLELNAIERDYFGGKLKVIGTKNSWVCQRIELNAMSAGQLVDYIDKGISRVIDAQNIDKKVIPPEATLNDKANKLLKHDLGVKVDEAISQLLKVGNLKSELLKSIGGSSVFDQEFNQDVSEYLIDNELVAINDDLMTKIKELVEAAIKAA